MKKATLPAREDVPAFRRSRVLGRLRRAQTAFHRNHNGGLEPDVPDVLMQSLQRSVK